MNFYFRRVWFVIVIIAIVLAVLVQSVLKEGIEGVFGDALAEHCRVLDRC